MSNIFSYDGITAEILIRVSAISLFRLKCVCRSWYNLISSPWFVINHTRRTRPASGLYIRLHHQQTYKQVPLQYRDISPRSLSFINQSNDKTKFRILDSQNGLILCLNSHSDTWQYYCVCNPTMQQYAVIPYPPPTSSICLYYFYSLAFDPTISLHYKVVRKTYRDPYECVIDVFSSKDKTWTRSHVSGLTPSIITMKRVFWNGAVNWFGRNGSHQQFYVDENKLIESQNIKVILKYRHQFLGECGGDLILVDYSNDLYEQGFRIHAMKKGTRNWRLKKVAKIRNVKPELGSRFNVISVLKGSRAGDYVLLLTDETEVFSYDTDCKTIIWLHEFRHDDRVKPHTVAHKFIESLCPV